jgi:HNH endonuclease
MTNSALDIETYTREVECHFKDERYSVRDNGAVMRYPKTEGRKRADDSNWTFGKLNTKTGYLELGGHRVHQIIATAFYGIAPRPTDVVVHLDTDRRNNRSDNLFWVSRFVNTILTPHNCEKIRKICGGSIEALLKDISLARESNLPMQFNWIANIPQTEASIALERLVELGVIQMQAELESLDEWLARRWDDSNRLVEGNTTNKSTRTLSLTENSLQIDWYVPSEFPCCPRGVVEDPILAYHENLKVGLVFCRNKAYVKNVLETAISEDKKTIYVLSVTPDEQEAIKPWALAKITYEGHVFLHYNLGSYFEAIGAEKYFQLARGKDWAGGDCFDDYC